MADKYDDLFDRIDTNVDGEIDASELRLAMTTEHNVRISASQVSTSVTVSPHPPSPKMWMHCIITLNWSM